MEGECKVTLEPHTEAEQKTFKSSRLTAILLAFMLCLAAAAAVLIFNTHAKGPEPDENTFDLHHKLRQISNIRAAIHLEGEHNEHISDSVEWRNQVDQSHSQGGLELKDNEIVIPHNGLYFVYSQVTFRVSCSSSEADVTASKPMVNLSHTVLRRSSSYGYDDEKTYIPILHSTRTACQKTGSTDPDADGKWFSAIYMGAVFNLRRGDRLKTKMEENMLQQLEDGTGNNFFGVFAL
ncbi:tumor necrosis factor a (TNF superfamily, member 2) [Melanotaenia boesemani]|uniref:tumor necrosis factor a (TNF superfamily, member 2) n=1 Tax=Melanotaenia boesemani TaxID=1250792 RepID=UPI001C042A4A|nr:tumor necrosis factor a (TNF superfamily, member 2) [Melanotaenia boesemani]